MDFSEFETAGQGVWNLGGIVDYAGKVALGCPISATKTAQDAIAALEHARDHAAQLLGRPLAEDRVDPDTGQAVQLILVTDNGACFRAAAFARHLRARRSSVTSAPVSAAPRPTARSSGSSARSSTSTSTATTSPTASASRPKTNRYLEIYNTIRPHEALAQTLPIDAYLADPITPSTRHDVTEP